MRLQRLIVQGFKSFKDRTTIEFDDGITGIVGPNGCGKSNIVDALFWVMGEQSAKHLRGTNMKDLIFSGSSKYSPAAFAEVTLVIENTNGKHIHISGSVVKPLEIQLTRKLYRNGETEYRINGEPARLKDIHEVFMDTGAGAKSYSIIAQGEINKLVQAKPEERRVMIEEVAGITKFKLRKRESLKKIEATQMNLSRLEDLQNEIYKNLKSLEKQAEKAEKAKTLKERIQKYDLIIDSHKELDFLQDYVNGNNLLTVRLEEKERLVLEKASIEIQLEEEKVRKEDLMDRLDSDQDEFNQNSKVLAASEEKIKHLKKSLKDKIQLIETKNKENKELEIERENREIRKIKLTEELEELKSFDHESTDLSSLEEKVELLKNQLFDLEEEFNSEKNASDKFFTESMTMDHEIIRNQSKLAECARLLQDLTLEIETIEKSSTQWNDELWKEKEKFTLLQTQYDSLKEESSVLKTKFHQLREEVKKLEDESNVLHKQVVQIEAKRDSLVSVKNSEEASSSGVKSILDLTSRDKAFIFGSEVKVAEEYTEASETILNHLMSLLISSEKSSFADWFKASEGSFDILYPQSFKMSAESVERLNLQGLGTLVALNDIVTINESLAESSHLRAILEGYFIAEESEPEAYVKLNTDIAFKGIVSRNGKILVKKSLDGINFIQFKTQDQMGAIERNNLIDKLSVELEEYQQKSLRVQTELTTKKDQLNELEKLEQQKSEEFNKISIEHARLFASLDSKDKLHHNSNEKLNLLMNRRKETSLLRLELLEMDEKLQKNKIILDQKIASFSEIKQNLSDRIQDAKITYENERDDFRSLKLKMETFDSQFKTIHSQLEDITAQIERMIQKSEANNEFLSQVESDLSQMESEIHEVESFNKDQAEILSEKEEQLSLLKDQLSELLLSMQSKETSLKEINGRVSKIEKENVEVEFRINQIKDEEDLLVRNNFEKYRIDLRSVLRVHLELTEEKCDGLKDTSLMFKMLTDEGEVTLESVPYEFHKMFPGEIKERKEKLKEYKSEFNRLGEINWQAIEDYDRQKLRYDFLKSQEEELKKSLTDLQTAILHIDEKSKIRFKDAFTEVNERFSKVFPIIFGGGSAQLDLVGSLDDPECGVDIIAQPPGKKMQSIQLMSGGEKAMTAVSLIFSIFLVKPSPFCLLDEVDAPLDDANVGRFNELLREMSTETQFILITHNKKTMELNDTLYGVTMQEPGVSKAVSVQLH